MAVSRLSASATCVSLVLATVACGDGDDTSGGNGSGGAGAGSTTGAGAGGPSGPGSGGSGSGGAPPGATTLVSGDWALEPGTEIYQCTRLTLAEDVYVAEFHPVIPPGTHHTVLGIDGGATPDGTVVCSDPFETGGTQVYGSGVGSQPMIFPDGVAVKLAAGQQLLLNLHLFNATAAPISGTSSIEVVTVAPGAVDNEAQLAIWGKAEGLTVAPNQVSTQSATCSTPNATSLIVVQPHMHTLGRHLKLTHAPAATKPVVLFDEDYSFDAQVHRLYEPAVAFQQGDQLTIDCTYDNPTANTVVFGESTTDEMCFAGFWYYPAGQPFCF